MEQPNESVIQVLIVEDDVKIAEINRRFVEKVSGYQVVGIATDEPQAQEQLAILHPHLVLLDLYFPDMNGLDFLRYINLHHPQTDVIMITAAKEVEMVKEAIRGGVYDFIIKPVVFARFQETLHHYQAYHRRLQQLIIENVSVNQTEIDELLEGTRRRGSLVQSETLPKGIDKLTMNKVANAIKQAEEGRTAVQVGEQIGASRPTARRYLEYLVSLGDVSADLTYGAVGRPERVYRWNRKK